MTLQREEPQQERLYSFANMYFAGIHAGIQTSHTIARMSQKYSMNEGFVNLADPHELDAGELFGEWAKRRGGETIIVKNGGMQGDLQDLLHFLQSEEHSYPFDFFNESYYAAGGALTNVSIVVPERIWKLADAVRRGEDIIYTSESHKHYAFFDPEKDAFAPMDAEQDPGLMVYIIPRRENLQESERKGRVPQLYGNEEMFVYTDFDMQLITRMNRAGLM